MTKKPQSVSDFLSAPPPHQQRRCLTCLSDAKFVAAIDEFAAALAAGRTSIPWSMFHRTYLVAQLGYPHSYTAMLNHNRNCRRQKP